MSRTGVAIIGLGMAARPHMLSLRDLSDRAEVISVFSPTEARRIEFSKTFDVPAAGSLDAVFSDPRVAAVLVLTPPSSHAELVARARASGKHVLLEKPLEISTDRAERMVDEAERSGIRLGVVLQHRFRPVSVALRELVAGGRLGDIVSASARLANWRPQTYYDQPGRGTLARDGGGVLLTQGIHTLDLLLSVAGDDAVEAMAFAVTTPVHRMETEDLVAGAVRFRRGAIGSVFATTAAYPGAPDAIELIGTKGTARIEHASLVAQFHDGAELRSDDGAATGGAGADPMAFSHLAHRAVIADFLSAVENGTDPGVTGREALKVHRLIDALLRSARSGRREAVEA
jgi:UDP-N-acetyl-2-amino-2-deoxyglucuronate dehydrogenase